MTQRAIDTVIVSRFRKVAIAAIGGFVATFAPVVLYWGTGENNCSGEECALEYAAVMTWAIVAGSLVGAACGFAMYAWTRLRDDIS